MDVDRGFKVLRKPASKALTLAVLCAMFLASVTSCGPTPAPPAASAASATPTAMAATTAPEPTGAMEVAETPASTAAPVPSEAPSPTEPPVGEGTSIVIAIPEDPPSFNAAVFDTGYDAMVMELVLLGLTEIDPEGNVYPELAAELPTEENGEVVIDEEAWTMDVVWKMRDDVFWADGQPVTAKDVIFTYEAISNPETGIWIPGIDYIDAIELIDDTSFVIHYNYVYPGYLTQFGGEQLVIWPAHYCDMEQGFTAWDCGREPLSDGPYMLQEWAMGDHLTFVRNPNYYQQGKPGIDEIVVRIVPDASVARTMLVGGDADIYMWATEPMIEDLKGVDNVDVSVSPTNRWVMRLFPNEAAKGSLDSEAEPHPILSDVRVRQAIRMAIDVDTISQQIFLGYGMPVWSEFYRSPYQCDIPRPKYDPEGAAALLEEAGWTDQNGDGVRECHGCLNAEEGYPMEMDFVTYAEYGEPLELTQQLVAEMLGKIGMKLNLSIVEGNVLWADYQSDGIEQRGEFDLDMWDDGYAGVDPTDFLWQLYYSEAAQPDHGWNVVRWINPDFDALLDEAYTLDEGYRQDLFCQMAQILDEQVPNILLFSTVNADAHSTRIEGIQSTVNDVVTWNVADWKVVK
jgi:peptide/nickel transport system substrate-binding protein